MSSQFLLAMDKSVSRLPRATTSGRDHEVSAGTVTKRCASVAGRGAVAVARGAVHLIALAALSPVILMMHAGKLLHNHLAGTDESENKAWLAEMQDFDRF